MRTSPARPGRLFFVCSGNICRSPVAAHTALRLLAGTRDSAMPAVSAGLIAEPGDRPNEHTLRAAADMGLDLSRHRARRLEMSDLQDTDLVLVMERRQRESILRRSRLPAGSVVYLASYARPDLEEIADPGGFSPWAYDECFALIRSAVEGLLSTGLRPRP